MVKQKKRRLKFFRPQRRRPCKKETNDDDDLLGGLPAPMLKNSECFIEGNCCLSIHFVVIVLSVFFLLLLLEHAVAAWSPWNEGDKDALERVQKRMIRFISD